MKHVTMDWTTYQHELRQSEFKGYKNALTLTLRLMHEALAGANEETLLSIMGDEVDADFVKELYTILGFNSFWKRTCPKLSRENAMRKFRNYTKRAVKTEGRKS